MPEKRKWKPGQNLTHLGDLPVLGSMFRFSLGKTLTGGSFLYMAVKGKPGGVSVMADDLDSFIREVKRHAETVKSKAKLSKVVCLSTKYPKFREAFREDLGANPEALQDHQFVEDESRPEHCAVCSFGPETWPQAFKKRGKRG